MKLGYVPKRGDLIWLDFTPQAGHEQAGRRPTLVISKDEYNRKVGLLLACPVTRQKKGYPFEVELPAGLPIAGVVLADQIRTLDWRARKAAFIGRVDRSTVAEVLARFSALIGEE